LIVNQLLWLGHPYRSDTTVQIARIIRMTLARLRQRQEQADRQRADEWYFMICAEFPDPTGWETDN